VTRIVPTKSQQEVRDYTGLSLRIVAPAGCGKTEALALRAAGLLQRKALEPGQRILVTTFTNRARDNILERLRAYVPPSAMKSAVTVSNFHGFAARLFKAHANVIGLDSNMTLPESDWIGDQCRKRSLSFKASDTVQGLLRETKQEGVDDAEVRQQLVRASNRIALEIENQRVYEHRLTYDDLPRLAELILARDEVADLYRQHFAAILVDEFQDLTPQQYRIINHIGAGKTTFAGDLAQGIYGFAGADPISIDKATRAECSHQIEFSESHRSAPAVLNAVNSLAHLTGGTILSSALPSSWPGGGVACVERFSSVDAEARWVARSCRAILSRAPNHRVGILSRIGSRRRFIDAEIESSGLPNQRWNDAFLDTETAHRLKTMLSGISTSAFAAATDPLLFLRDAAGMADVQDPSTRQALAEALAWCADLLQQGVTTPDIRKRVHVGDNSTLLTLPGVHLLTGHVGKGQQFDWVVIAGLEDGAIPDFRATTPDTQAEEARILSVMISRARLGVVLTHCSSVPATDGTPYRKHESPYLRTLRSCLSPAADLNAWIANAPLGCSGGPLTQHAALSDTGPPGSTYH
jgi:DNA helicase-2/ATP-dependent DNA helicase PcrA